MWMPGDEAQALEIAKLFLAHGADPSIRNKQGQTAADLARKRGLDEVAELLSRGSATPGQPNREDTNMPIQSDEASMYVPGMAAILSRWFTNYEEASASREAEGGFLLPFKHQFFVTTREAIRELGLDPDDPDWERINWDWVRPADREAWERLKARRRSAT